MPSPLKPREPGDNVAQLPTGSNSLRVVPHNFQLERSLLGAILANNKVFDRVADFLKPEHFSEPVCGRLFSIICRMIEQGQQASPVSLKTFTDNDDLVREAGGFKFIVGLSGAMVTLMNGGDYGRQIYQLHLRRELIVAGQTLLDRAYDAGPDESGDQILEEHEAALFNLASSTTHRSRMVTAGAAVGSAIELAQVAHRLETAVVGVPTGLRDLDGRMGGLHPGDLSVWAGRPSMGKTALLTTACINAAQFFATTQRVDMFGRDVVCFSLEMSAGQLGIRVVSIETGLDMYKIRTGQLSSEDFGRLVSAQTRVDMLPFHIDDTPAATVNSIRTRARRLARRPGGRGVGLIGIDYLQLIAAPGASRGDNRANDLATITRGLKALAGDLGCPVVALSQLSRAVEQRDDKRPQLSDLRESGAIEADADNVIFVYRDQYYLERSEPRRRDSETDERFQARRGQWAGALEASHNVCEAIVAKQRMGPVCTVRLHFDASCGRFGDLAREPSSRGADYGPKEDFSAAVDKAAGQPPEQMDMGV